MTAAIRGATTVESNEKEQIYEAAAEMMKEIIEANNIDKAYPAVAVRNMGITEAALMCVQEMHVDGSLRKCLRVMVTVEGDYDRKNLRHAYLRGAVGLRPDLRR